MLLFQLLASLFAYTLISIDIACDIIGDIRTTAMTLLLWLLIVMVMVKVKIACDGSLLHDLVFYLGSSLHTSNLSLTSLLWSFSILIQSD